MVAGRGEEEEEVQYVWERKMDEEKNEARKKVCHRI